MLSRKSKYAIKALMALARNKEGKPMRISQISEEERIPKKFLEAILLELRNHGVLGSKIGVNGGYYLLKKPKDIFLTQVIRLTDGPIALIPCASLNFYEPCEDCPDEASCGLRAIVKDVRIATLHILSNTSIADTLAREKKLGKTSKRRK